MRLVDFDNVSLSSLNRHAVATRADVGTPKSVALAKHFAGFAPWCKVEAPAVMFNGEAAEELLAPNAAGRQPDYVLDCIDDTETKAQLLLACEERGLRVVSALSAGGKADFTRMHCGSLQDAVVDHLGQRLRYILRFQLRGSPDEAERYARVSERTTCVYSSADTRRALLPLTATQAEAPDEHGAIEGMRLRVVPVLGTMPAIFGQAMAAHVLCCLAGTPIQDYIPLPRINRQQAAKMLSKLQQREKRVFGDDRTLENPCMDIQNVEYCANVVNQGRCAVTGVRMGHTKFRGILTRWDASRRAERDNLVVLQQQWAARLLEEGQACIPEQARRRIEGRFAWVRAMDRASGMLPAEEAGGLAAGPAAGGGAAAAAAPAPAAMTARTLAECPPPVAAKLAPLAVAAAVGAGVALLIVRLRR